MNRISEKLDELRMIFERLSGREKVLVLAMLGGFVVVVAIMLSIGIKVSLAGLEDRVETKREYYEKIQDLKSRYQTAQMSLNKFQRELENRKNTLTRDIGQLATETGVEISQINSAKGGVDKKAGLREESVKVEIRKVELPPLMNFLENIEKQDPYFRISNIDMKRRFDNKDLIDVSFSVSTLLPMEEEF